MRFKLILSILLFLIPLSAAAAHPHMSFDARMEFEYRNNEMIGVWQEWRFDKFFSGSIRQAYDLDWDNAFDTEETAAVYEGGFDNLKNYDYFIFYRTGGKTLVPSRVSDFSVWMEEDVMVYRFFVPLEVKNREVWLSVFDITYFCAVFYEDRPAKTLPGGDGGLIPRYRRVKNTDNPIYYNPLSPANDNTRYYEPGPGLETAYPEEIHVAY